MMSAASISAMIRAKKKKMEDDKDAVSLSGIPMDAQDIDTIKRHEIGEHLSENHPVERDEDPSLDSLIASDGSNASEPRLESPDPHEEDERKQKQMKIKAMLGRMGR